MDSLTSIKVGFVGAGANTRLHHLPGLTAIAGVELVSVCNRTPESSKKVALEFGIPKIYDDWKHLVDAGDTNAICIGTWPYLHHSITIAALRNNKHVLCEARMAMDAWQAHDMLNEAQSRPHLIAQLVPVPFTLKIDRTIQRLISQGFLGELLYVDMRILNKTFLETHNQLHWRQDRDLSGYNTLYLGIWYETLMRWVGPATQVLASSRTFVSERLGPDGKTHPIRVPDHVDVMCDLGGRAQARLTFSTVTGFAPDGEVWLYGSQGTLMLNVASMTLYGGTKEEQGLSEIPIPEEEQGFWRVEEEFVNAIRGEENISHTTFVDGVKYMEFTEAVARSARTGKAISLPL